MPIRVLAALSEVKRAELTRVKAQQAPPLLNNPMQTSTRPAGATATKHPFSVPARLSPDLARVRAYWEGLLRGAATMPFWDDAKLSDLPDLTDRLFLLNVFDRPERFRFDMVGRTLADDGLSGVFLDEADLDHPFEYLRAQATATVECAAPTLFRHQAERQAYARLLLPMWGDGRLSMLLGAVDPD